MKTMGEIIAGRRKELGMTQKELADRLNITDKAVSKWERDVSCPDRALIPKLAELLGIPLEELMQVRPNQQQSHKGAGYAMEIALGAIPLAMGIAVVVTGLLGQLDAQSGFTMLGIGLACLGLRAIKEKI
ncbi:MAG: helix-turn-helix transcriptional regulator [Clostridiales bacterium]|nr:helix-turn-helix transcriptional regulator [Clostridiales bacterium]